MPFWNPFRRRRPAAETTVLIYKTRTCPLCEEALHVVAKERSRAGFRLEVLDISDDTELLSRHGVEVPVVFVDGVKRFFGRVDPVLLRRLIDRRH